MCASVALPVNVMMTSGLLSVERLADLGVSRVSYGIIPYVSAMKHLGEEANAVFAAK
jgi:2-methylisocitrate lyase-like PEP mutase family enzyme